MTEKKFDFLSLFRADSWANILTGINIAGRDKRLRTQFAAAAMKSKAELSAIYRSDGFGRRIIDLPTSELTREWFDIEGDIDNAVQDELTRINAKEKIADLIRWAKLYGGAIAVILADDGSGDLAEPLNVNGLKSVEGLNVFDRHSISWNTSDLYTDPNNPKYQQPEFYTIAPINEGNPFRVHDSRCLRLEGSKLPPREKQLNLGWGDSDLQKCYDRLKGVGSAYDSIEFIMDDFVQLVLQIDGLGAMIARGQEDLVIKRMNVLDLSRHIAHTTVLDTNEKFEKKSSSVQGLSQLLGDMVLALSAASGIPVTLLVGQSPAGLNATGDSDIRFFYDKTAAEQTDKIEPAAVKPLVQLLMLASDGPTKGKELDQWKIRWRPLWQMSQNEQAEMRAKMAEADQKYFDMGVLYADEIRSSRFAGDEFSLETTIDTSLPGADPGDTDE